ncbi:MAG: alpha/beta hydrolase [Myxococcales bacterium]|nr:MAG: alpha/beta hydrolase [Myxococcales bacterium]
MGFGDISDLDSIEPPALRALMAGMPTGAAEPRRMAEVFEREIDGPDYPLKVRIYRPETATEGPPPIVVYFHGGGFCICDLDTHDATCRSLAHAAGALLVSVDYRLAPEAKFPAAAEDCYAATVSVAAVAAELGGDPQRIAVAGDSAGGNLAAVVALMARDRGGPALAHQLLIYPVIDHDFDTVSYREFAEGYLLTRQMMMWFWRHYLSRPEDGDDPFASPIRADNHIGLPPTTIVTAEFDPLRDEGEAYGRRLRESGVTVEIIREEGLIHGFFGFEGMVERADRAIAATGERLRIALANEA